MGSILKSSQNGKVGTNWVPAETAAAMEVLRQQISPEQWRAVLGNAHRGANGAGQGQVNSSSQAAGKDAASLLPAEDYRADHRRLAQVLSALAHDSPELQTLLRAAGLAPGDTLSPRLCRTLARYLLNEVDKAHAEDTLVRPWNRLPHPDRNREPAKPGLNTLRLSEVAAREVEWQRPGFTARGKLTLLSGPPGVGKTYLMLDHIARLTTGRPYPGDPAPAATALDPCPRRDALFVSMEDAADDTLLPRLTLLGGDPSRVHTLDFVYHHPGTTDRRLQKVGYQQQTIALDQHLGHLDAWLAANPLVELVVFDPISAVLGKVDAHRDAEVRRVLGPLAQLAERRRVAVVAITHLNKLSEGPAINRSMGSIGFVAAARIAWQVCADPDDPTRSLLLPVKVNLGVRPSGRAFRVSVAGLSWEEEVAVTADEVLRPADQGARAPAKEEAKQWLQQLLEGGPIPAAEVWEAARAEGLCEKTVKAAKKELGIVAKKTGGKGAPWTWHLPGA